MTPALTHSISTQGPLSPQDIPAPIMEHEEDQPRFKIIVTKPSQQLSSLNEKKIEKQSQALKQGKRKIKKNCKKELGEISPSLCTLTSLLCTFISFTILPKKRTVILTTGGAITGFLFIVTAVHCCYMNYHRKEKHRTRSKVTAITKSNFSTKSKATLATPPNSSRTASSSIPSRQKRTDNLFSPTVSPRTSSPRTPSFLEIQDI